MIVAAVPVKGLGQAKQRLAGVLGGAERVALARAMLVDVLRAVTAAGLDAVWVVTRDPEAAAVARGLGAEPLAEDADRGHTSAVAFAQRVAIERGARTFVTVPGDVPCVTAAEVAALAAAAPAPAAVVFAPSRSGRGTNGVALSPPDAMPLTFGEPSFDAHVAAAGARGLAPRVLRLSGLALDVDDAGDLRALAETGPRTESGRLATAWLERGLAGVPAAARPGAPVSGPSAAPYRARAV